MAKRIGNLGAVVVAPTQYGDISGGTPGMRVEKRGDSRGDRACVLTLVFAVKVPRRYIASPALRCALMRQRQFDFLSGRVMERLRKDRVGEVKNCLF